VASAEGNPLIPGNGGFLGWVVLAVLVGTLVGAVLALRREARAGRPLTGWLLAFWFTGPIGVLLYAATQLRAGDGVK
jgi:HAMP domain-containing protein